MNITAACSKCKKELKIIDVIEAPHLNEIVLYVSPCDNKDHYDCTDCDDLEIAKGKIKELREKLAGIRELIKETE